jgi:hypothetical protein
VLAETGNDENNPKQAKGGNAMSKPFRDFVKEAGGKKIISGFYEICKGQDTQFTKDNIDIYLEGHKYEKLSPQDWARLQIVRSSTAEFFDCAKY